MPGPTSSPRERGSSGPAPARASASTSASKANSRPASTATRSMSAASRTRCTWTARRRSTASASCRSRPISTSWPASATATPAVSGGVPGVTADVKGVFLERRRLGCAELRRQERRAPGLHARAIPGQGRRRQRLGRLRRPGNSQNTSASLQAVFTKPSRLREGFFLTARSVVASFRAWRTPSCYVAALI